MDRRYSPKTKQGGNILTFSRKGSGKIVVFMIVLLLISSLSYAQEGAALYQFGKSLRYSVLDAATIVINSNKYKISNRIIIRSKQDKVSLLSQFTEIKELIELASFDKDKLFLASLAQQINPIKYAERVHSHKDVIYAQPDLLQVRKSSGCNGTHEIKRHDDISSVFKKIWQQSKGEGISIAIIDDGFDLSHPELANTKTAFSYDVDGRILNARPKVPVDRHGNKVAGLIFAKHDKHGVEGIAPNADYIYIRQVNS